MKGLADIWRKQGLALLTTICLLQVLKIHAQNGRYAQNVRYAQNYKYTQNDR